MSSACICHTNEWCFYCEMYVPMERKAERQAKEIERLTAANDNVHNWREKAAREGNQAKSKLELAVKALEEIKSGIEWNWETYVDIASDALEEIEWRNTNA